MCETSNYAAPPATAWLIFAKQSARRNDILREEVCHFWTVHICIAKTLTQRNQRRWLFIMTAEVTHLEGPPANGRAHHSNDAAG
jgi:hypothetical protein